MQHIVKEKTSTLFEILSLMSPDSSKTTLRSWIKEKRITIDNTVANRADEIVTEGQKICVHSKKQFIEGQIQIVYEDTHLVAIEKPEGVLSVATVFDKSETAHAILKRHYHPRKVYVVHRLDQETSGVMLYALSEEGYNGLKALFEKHDIKRCYRAIVRGNISPSKGTWASYLHEDVRYVVHSSDNPEEGTLAITHYEVEKITPRYTLLRLTLETGRKNQIRVHCRESGCPIVGDKKYGEPSDSAKRLCLHAATLEFAHPVTKKVLSFISPMPESFYKLLS